MNESTSLKTVLLIAVASVLATGMELAGIDRLAEHRAPAARHAAVVQLPTVVVTAPRETQVALEIQQLPRMVIVARRDARTAQVAHTASEI